jgi:hypothetical protein
MTESVWKLHQAPAGAGGAFLKRSLIARAGVTIVSARSQSYVSASCRSSLGPRRSCGGLSERREELTPIPGFVEDRAHFVAPITITIQTPMLELHACVGSFSDKAHLYFRVQRRIILKVGGNVPGENKPRVGLPRENATPVTRASVIPALKPTTTHAWFDDCIHCVGFANLVRR